MNYCKFCNNEIKKNKTYCSNECQVKLKLTSNRIERNCPICNTIFVIHKNNKKITCGKECNKKWNVQNSNNRIIKMQQNNLTKYGTVVAPKSTILNYCKICNKKIKSRQIYCSVQCREIQHSKDSREIRSCAICNKEFEAYKKSKQVVCSDICQKQYINLPENKKTRYDKIHNSLKLTYSNKEELNKISTQTKATKLLRYGYAHYNGYGNHKSKIEIEVSNKILNSINGFVYLGYEYDIKIGNNIYEIDGDYWHPSSFNNLTLRQLTGPVNDYKKEQLLINSEYTLYRIHTSDIKDTNLITEEYLQQNNYIPNRVIEFNQIICNKEYFTEYITFNNKEKLKKYSNVFLKFIRTFQSQLIGNIIVINMLNLWNNDILLLNAIEECIGCYIEFPSDFTINNLIKLLNNHPK